MPLQPAERGFPLVLEGVHDDLGVRPGGEAVAAPLELPAQLAEVVDLTIADELDPAVLAGQRLSAVGAADDGEPVASHGQRRS